MGTHLGTLFKNNWYKTYCGKLIQRQALGIKKRPPAVLVRNEYGKWYDIIRVDGFCEKCLADDRANYNLVEILTNQIKKSNEVHILESKNTDTSVRVLCGKSWDIRSMFRNGIGYITLEMLRQVTKDHRFCEDCCIHPRTQLQVLADTEL
jgi:hypothetical protein